MTENLDINTKFYSYDGILGRRDYCVNIIYISAISYAVNIPFILYWFIKCSSLEDIFKFNTIFLNSPFVLKFITLLGSIALLVLLIPTVHRRVRDLFAQTNKYITAVFGILFGLTTFWYLFPFNIDIITHLVAWVAGLCLLFIPGKVTSKLPYDYTKIFNWGAYFGTWIWGLYNKSYITLFMWAVGSTPLRGLFQIYCGLKGNEWAYKGKKWNDVEAFNKSQEKQTIFFICLNFLIIPALLMLPIILLIALVITFASADSQNRPAVNQITSPPAIEQQVNQDDESQEKVELDGIYKTMAYFYFDSYDFSEDEYKFYVSEEDWKKYTILEKLDLMSRAQKISKGYRYKVNQKKYPNKCTRTSNYDELNKIKIYSTEKHQLLGEFNEDIDYKNISAKDAFKSVFKMWKFYEIEK